MAALRRPDRPPLLRIGALSSGSHRSGGGQHAAGDDPHGGAQRR